MIPLVLISGETCENLNITYDVGKKLIFDYPLGRNRPRELTNPILPSRAKAGALAI